MDDPQPSPDHGAGESERERRLANVVLLLVFVLLVGAGVWLANAMFDQRILEDCLAQGRRNCAPIEAPSR
jgi:hypothetical protein